MGLASRSDFLNVILTPVAVRIAFCGAAFSICPGSRGKNSAPAIGFPLRIVSVKVSLPDSTAVLQVEGSGLGKSFFALAKRGTASASAPWALEAKGRDRRSCARSGRQTSRQISHLASRVMSGEPAAERMLLERAT